MEHLKLYLDHNGLSQKAFAAMIEVDPSVLCRYISGEVTPSLSAALRIKLATKGKVPVDVWVAA